MRGWRILRRTVLIVVATVAVLVILVVTAVYILSGTDWGHERVRRLALETLANSVHGRLSIGKISGNLLTGMRVDNIAITDSTGAPFVTIASITGKYSIKAIAQKRIWIRDAVAVEPRIVLDRPPGGKWNWQRIFPQGKPQPGPHTTGWLDWIQFTNARVVNGQLVVRSPWNPSAHLRPSARDSAIREALAGKSRLMITRAPGGNGFQKLVQLDSVTATMPLLRLADPTEHDRLADVSSLSMNAFPFRPPGAVVRNLRGTFPFNNDSAWWRGAVATMPNSKASGDGSYVFNTGDMTMTIHGDPVSFADARWIYPALPPEGHGSGDLHLTWRGAVQDYMATNTNVALGATRISGAVGVTLSDTLAIHDTKVRFSALETRTLERLIKDFKSPRQGTLSGNATLSGGRHALALSGDVTFADRRAGVSRVIGSGEVGFLEQKGVRARDLKVRLLPLQVAMARTWYPSLPIDGIVTGSATLNGSTNSSLDVTANLDHRDRGTRSVVEGKASIRLAGVKRFDVDVNARPVSLEEVGRFFPAAGLQGSAAGPIHLTGLVSDLKVIASLRLPDGGRFTTIGTLDLASKEKAYDLTSTLFTLNLNTIDKKAPVTSLTARAALRGRGTAPETMSATVIADLSASRWLGGGGRDSIAVDTASVRGTVAGGRVSLDKFYAVGAHTAATATGSFGITKEQTGTLSFSVSTDSLGAFNRLLPANAVQTGVVPPRPQLLAREIQRARADSIRVAKATEMERLISGRPGPSLVVKAPTPVPADTMYGKVSAKGTLTGNIYAFDLRGTASGQDVVVRGNSAHRFQTTFAWTQVRTPQAALRATLSADTVSARGFAFDSVTVSATYAPAGGHAELTVNQSDKRRYAVTGDYALFTDRREIHLSTLILRFDTTSWRMSRPSVIQWGGPGVQINDFELRNSSTGRIFANGLLPTEGVADFALTVENFPIANLVDIAQTDINMTGIASANLTMSGTLSAPAFRGTFGLTSGTYNGVAVPILTGRLGYVNRMLVGHVDALRQNGKSMTTIDGRIPINLALSGVTGDRMLPDPMSVDLVADSLPLELISQFTGGTVSDLHGRATANVSMSGTLRRPVLSGKLALKNGLATISLTGAKLVDATATVHMANDTVFVDSVTAVTRNGRTVGTVRASGSLAVGDWREPALNLFLVSNGAQLIDNKYGHVRVDAGVALTGPFREAYLSGALTLVQGVIYAPEPGTLHALIGAGDPALYNILDTTSADARLFPPPSPLVTNLRIELAVAVKHDNWVRNREANVEIYTEEPLSLRQEQGSLILTGAVTTDRGEYEVLSKRFQIKRGSALFIGTPDLDPTLQITGEYQVNVAARGALNIRVIVGGSLHRPKVALESDAQPPKTQSELLSLLAFGQSSSTLIASSSSSITGSAASSDLFGVGAEAAVQRLAGVALGVAVQQFEMQAGRTFGTDVFDITPGDVPIFNGSGPRDFFAQTRIEAGKYINSRTFLSVQEQAGLPGLSVDHRTANGWRFFASTAPRILLREPTLSNQPHRTLQSYGGFVLREWRF